MTRCYPGWDCYIMSLFWQGSIVFILFTIHFVIDLGRTLSDLNHNSIYDFSIIGSLMSPLHHTSPQTRCAHCL